MTRLLRDRYLAIDHANGWDLVTGERVRTDGPETADVESEPPLPSLLEVLDHGREGTPRWLVAHARPASHAVAVARRAALDGRARGFVPIGVDVYLRLRSLMDDQVRERALLLIGGPATTARRGHAALLDAAAGSSRPHVLVTFAPLATGSSPCIVREARAVYGHRPIVPARGVTVLSDEVTRQLARAARAPELAGLGRHAAAERLLRDVAGALTRRGAHLAAINTLLALGRLLLERGRVADAHAVFQNGASLADAARLDSAAIDCRLWQANARTESAQLTAAESIARAALLSGSLTPGQRVLATAILVRVLTYQRRFEEVPPLEPFDDLSDLDASTAVLAGVVAVEALVRTGRVFEAGQHARRLLSLAEDSRDGRLRGLAHTAHLRVLAAAGDLALAEQRLGEALRAARETRTPLGAARARLIWADALRRAGRERELRRELAYLQRLRAVAPPLLQHTIGCLARGEPADAWSAADRSRCEADAGWIGSIPSTLTPASLIQIAQEEDGDTSAVARVIARCAEALQASRIDLCSIDAGPLTRLVNTGSGLPTSIGGRVLEAGVAIGPERGEAGYEIGVPVRLGGRLLAAIVARWPADRAPMASSREILEIAAAVLAPRVEMLLAAARERAQESTSVPELVGVSAAIAEVRKAIARAAAAPFAVLIEGESGVGKELVARAVHQLGPRRERHFRDVNCAALPDDLLEAELFGHARGAFTGAVVDRAGLFEDADGGTLFLDEIADLSLRAQAKLLRVLQQHEVRRLGETFSRPVDVRLVAAANRDMRAEAAAGRFRHDLLYRLDVIRIRIPPLRERPEDIPLLAGHFWRTAASRVGTRAVLTHDVLAALCRYGWPGNVRELQNVIAALAVASPTRGRVRAHLLPAAIAGPVAVTAGRLGDARAQFEQRFIEAALARAGGSRTRAARELGLSRQGLLKMMARLGIASAAPAPPVAAGGERV